MSAIDMQRPGPWTKLFPKALRLMAQLETEIEAIGPRSISLPVCNRPHRS